MVPPGGVFRLVDDDDDVRARERHGDFGLCGPQAGGFYALCAGPCDLETCANVLDHVALAGPAGPPAAVPCAIFSPMALDVSAATADQSVVRVGFSGGGIAGLASDWALGAASRD